MNARPRNELNAWTEAVLGSTYRVEPLAGDASARRYFRLRGGRRTLVLMDAPPEDADARNELERFVDVTGRLRAAGLHAPAIHAVDATVGGALLEDLGDRLYRDLVTPDNAGEYFPEIFRIMQVMAEEVDTAGLPDYDRSRLMAEMNLLPEWYAGRWLKQPFSAAELEDWAELTDWLCRMALEQPQVFVHRDLHSCNVLQADGGGPGIIDYQDAVRGPITYDLVSWLVDRYIRWPRTRLLQWYEEHRLRLGIDVDPGQWRRWCDTIGIQRKLKVLGIFARLALRDGKRYYLSLQPGFYRYLLHTAPLYEQTRPLVRILGRRPPLPLNDE